MKVGYVVNQYPSYSDPHIVDEILAHEEAGLDVEIYSLSPSTDTHYQSAISRVAAPVWYLTGSPDAGMLWSLMQEAGGRFPAFWTRLSEVREPDVRTVGQAIELARLVGQNGVLHLHAHFATAPTTVARMASSLAGIPYSFTAHTEELMGQNLDQEDLAAKIKDAVCTVTESDFGLAYIQQAFGVDAGSIERIYLGLRTEILPFTSPASRPRVVVAVGSLNEYSGFDDLISAIGKLKERGVQPDCHIIGTGPLSDELDAQISKNDLSGIVRLLGAMPEEEVQRAVRTASAFVVPSTTGSDGSISGIPALLLEAMTVGTPCIATAIGGIPEIVIDGQTGLHAVEKDPDSLASAIERLLDDDVLRVRLALKARVLVESEFNIHRNMERMRSFFGKQAPARHKVGGDGAPTQNGKPGGASKRGNTESADKSSETVGSS